MTPSLRTALTFVTTAALAASVASVARAQVSDHAPPGLENVGVQEHLGDRIPTDMTFRDHTGARVRLRDVIRGDRPVLLTLVYHSCPSFCSLVLDGAANAMAQQGWTAGVEYDVVTISIDPRDTPEVAADARRRRLFRYGREAAEEGWHFLVAEESVTGDELIASYGVYPGIERLTRALGFRYQWMPRQRQYAHPGVVMLLTPESRVARYLYGIEIAPNDLRVGLLEASEGRSVSTVERAILYCYRYDSEAQGYTLVAFRIMQIGGAATALTIFFFLSLFWWRERRRGDDAPQNDGFGLSKEASARS